VHIHHINSILNGYPPGHKALFEAICVCVCECNMPSKTLLKRLPADEGYENPSYAVTLPADWIWANKLGDGDYVNTEKISDNTIVIWSEEGKPPENDLEKDLEEGDLVQMEIVSGKPARVVQVLKNKRGTKGEHHER